MAPVMAMAAIAAVSARRMRGPRVTGCQAWAVKRSISSGVQPPSGPMASAMFWSSAGANAGVSPLRCASVEMTADSEGASVEMTAVGDGLALVGLRDDVAAGVVVLKAVSA